MAKQKVNNPKLRKGTIDWLNELEEGSKVSIAGLTANAEIPESTWYSWKYKEQIKCSDDDKVLVDEDFYHKVNNWYPVVRKKKITLKEKAEVQEVPEPSNGNPASVTSIADEMLEMAAKLERYAKVITKFDQAFAALKELEN